MRKSLLIFLISFFLRICCNAQSSELVSIRSSLPKIRDSLHYVDILNRMAMLSYEENIDSTFYYTEQARKIAFRLDYTRGLADALNNLGVFFEIKGNQQLAIHYYDDAYNNYKRLKDSANCVQMLMNIAIAYNEMGERQRAFKMFNSAMSMGNRLRKDSIMSLVIVNYLQIFPAHFNHNSMDYYIAKAKHIAAKYQDQRMLIAIDQLMADNLIVKGQRKEGMALLNQTITTALKKMMYHGSMDMIIDMGDNLAATDSTLAIRYYLQGLAIANQKGFLNYNQIIARKLFDFYSKHKDSLTAAIYSSQLIHLHDEKEKVDNTSRIDYLDYALIDQQLRLLKIQTKYQVALLILILIICSLFTVIIIIIRNNLQRAKRLNGQIVHKNGEMKKTLEALEQSQNRNSLLMKIVAHDLRSPIAAAISVIGLVKTAKLPPEDRKMLKLLEISNLRSLEMIENLLNINTTAEELTKKPVEIHTLLLSCVNLLEFKAAEKNQQLIIQTQKVITKVNGEKIWRVINNIITNAIKFSPQGAVINISLKKEMKSVQIIVKDNGIGIPSEMQGKIFDMFTEVKRMGTAGEKTFGLGLAISKQIMAAHDGKIWFESEAGCGSTFFIEFPIV